MLWVPEYGHILRGVASQNLADGELVLAQSDFNSVLTLLDGSEETALSSIFQYRRFHGTDSLQVQNYVGVVRSENDC